MKTWQALGKFIGGHMSLLVPIFVALGILFPAQISPAKPFVPAIFAFITFQGALCNTFHSTWQAFKNPRNLIVILLVTAVFMPLLAYLCATLLFSGNPQVICGVVLEYSVPVAVTSFMWVSIFGGDAALSLAAVLVSTVLSPFTIPATLQLLLGQTVEVNTATMMVDMLVMIAIPALAGTAVNELSHGWGNAKLSPVISPATRLLTLVVMAANATALHDYVFNMTAQRVEVAGFILIFAISGFVWGIVAGKLLKLPYAGLATMGFSCGLRNISSGAVLASQFFPGEAIFPVMCGTLFQQVLASFAGNAIKKLAK